MCEAKGGVDWLHLRTESQNAQVKKINPISINEIV